MRNDLLKRLVVGVITLFCVISLTFFLMRLLPGGPFDSERKLPPAIQANMEARYHLNEPLWVQYALYIGGVVQGDFGPSYKYLNRRVNHIVAESFGTSLRLGAIALLLGVGLGVLLGTIAGSTRQPWLDGILSLLGMSALSMPSFVFGGLLVLAFALHLKWLPAARLETPLHYLLPVMTLALAPFAYALMLTRTSVLETKTMPFVHIKRSYGVDEATITRRHVLRNSLLPLLSIIGPMAAAVVTGSFAVEYIFAIPGLGKHFITAVSNRDYTVVMGITIVYSVLLITFNTLTDILYGMLDPRLQDDARGGEA